MAEYIERANLIARIKYYVTHTPKDKREHYAYSVMLNEILNRPAADVVPKDGQTVELRVTIKEDEENGNQQ